MSQSPGDDDPAELYPHIATVGVQYGDPSGKYGSFLRGKLGTEFLKDPFYLWDTLAVAGLPTPTSSSAHVASGTSTASNSNSHKGGYKPTSGAVSGYTLSGTWYAVLGVAATFVMMAGHSL